MHETFRSLRAPLVALVMTGCGGGGGGSSGGGSEPPPPQEPPVVTTPTAVRVTGPTPFSSTCLAVPAGATAYANAEVEPHLAIDPANPNHLVAAWQQDRLSELGPSASNPAVTEGRLAVIRSTDKGVTWSAPTRIAQLLPVGTRVPSQASLTVRAGEILGTFAANPVTARCTRPGRIRVSRAARTTRSSWHGPPTAATPGAPRFASMRTPRFPPLRRRSPCCRAAWRETRLAGNFDLLDAPDANGLFVGDYQGLSGDGSTFVALYARTNSGDTSNRTDVFADRVNGEAIAASVASADVAARKTALPAWTSGAEVRVSQHLSRVREMRRERWRTWREAGPASRDP